MERDASLPNKYFSNQLLKTYYENNVIIIIIRVKRENCDSNCELNFNKEFFKRVLSQYFQVMDGRRKNTFPSNNLTTKGYQLNVWYEFFFQLKLLIKSTIIYPLLHCCKFSLVHTIPFHRSSVLPCRSINFITFFSSLSLSLSSLCMLWNSRARSKLYGTILAQVISYTILASNTKLFPCAKSRVIRFLTRDC